MIQYNWQELLYNYENGGLKNVNIAAKISSQSSWIKRLSDENLYDWKILPLHIIHKLLGKKIVFHSNLKVNTKLTKSFPKYYREIVNTWRSKLSCQTLVHLQFYLDFYGLTVKCKQATKVSSFLLFLNEI